MYKNRTFKPKITNLKHTVNCSGNFEEVDFDEFSDLVSDWNRWNA